MNVLVTGANGQLGTELRLASASKEHKFVFTDVNSSPEFETVYLDITDINAVRDAVSSNAVDVIVNCAAYTNVEKAESDPDTADLLNHKAAANLACAAAESGSVLIHISTDYVFQGNVCSPYKEDDIPSPLGVYGLTKLKGEQAVETSGCRYIIFRTAWLYSPFGNNFVKTMMRLTSQNDKVKVVSDQVGTPTYAADLASLIMKVIDDGLLDKKGIYHFTDEGVTSWYDFAEAVRAECGNNCTVVPCRSDEYPSKVRRPSYSVLDKSLVKKVFNISIPHWQTSLHDCICRITASCTGNA